MAASGIDGPPMNDSRKPEIRKGGKSTSKGKESMTANATKINIPKTSKDKEKTVHVPTSSAPSKEEHIRLTLKEMMAKQYPFLDSDVPKIFDELLQNNLIELPEMKRPEEQRRSNDPKYCKFHRLVSHPIQDCFVFKEKVMRLAREGKITLVEENASVNTISASETSDTPSSPEEVPKSKPVEWMTTISFSDEDLLLGSKPHNRPLYVTGYVLGLRRVRAECW